VIRDKAEGDEETKVKTGRLGVLQSRWRERPKRCVSVGTGGKGAQWTHRVGKGIMETEAQG